ncbi:chemotaxis protein CheW [Sphingomonas sp. ac-8]|uniref:chemotaxis protein CheW n=1 Tax=Sphingomonas sp. ac-8 TaxID=3242977 RepID=UPI003A7F7CF2
MTTTHEPGERKVVTFSLGHQMFGIDMSALIEIREWEEPTPLPGVAPYIKGVTNLRGTVVPVVGLAERIGWPASEIHSRSCILVVNIGGKHCGFLVDEVADIVLIKQEDVQPAPEVEIGENVISGLVQISARTTDGAPPAGGTMVSLLDLATLSLTRPMEAAA